MSKIQRTPFAVSQFCKFLLFIANRRAVVLGPINRRSTLTLRVMRRPEAHRHAYEIYIYLCRSNDSHDKDSIKYEVNCSVTTTDKCVRWAVCVITSRPCAACHIPYRLKQVN